MECIWDATHPHGSPFMRPWHPSTCLPSARFGLIDGKQFTIAFSLGGAEILHGIENNYDTGTSKSRSPPNWWSQAENPLLSGGNHWDPTMIYGCNPLARKNHRPMPRLFSLGRWLLRPTY